MASPPPAYVELQVTSNFSFLRGAAHPEELAAQAATLGHPAIAITDHNTLAGVVRGHLGAKEAGIRVIVGARLDLTDGPSLICLPTDRTAYGRLSQLLTRGKRRAAKGECHLTRADLLTGGIFARGAGQILLALPPEGFGDEFESFLKELRLKLKAECYLAAAHRYGGDDTSQLARLAELAATCGTPMVATNDVHYHLPERRALADVVTCIREHCTIDSAGLRLAANAERHLKPAGEMARLFRDYPNAVARTAEIAARCRFSLDELRYDYPIDPVPGGDTPDQALAKLAWAGAAERYPDGIEEKVRRQIAHELALIAELRYAPYFLTVQDIVRFARSQDILCQGRGSAANSAVCYCLGITAVDPARLDLLFERFVSAERDEPPDIDVDFEHERREEVIQYIYQKYGRARASLAATVISYRARSAMRDVGKAMGLSEDTVGALSGQVWGLSDKGLPEEVVRDLGLDPSDERLALALNLAHELLRFPRHLSQHVGGFVITAGRLDAMVPIENAAMDERTVIEWDKDDLDALGILKIDVLALGMLTCVRKGFDLLRQHYGRDLDLATVPAEEPGVYDMLCRADSLGVFQVESRAQMAFLPRMKPRNFYDLVIEVAIVRPGPIQGDMVHPYLRRRNGEERVAFPSRELEEVLGKTLGVPLFQEQAMKIAIVAAGFTPGEADGLRRAMATFRKTGTIHTFEKKMIDGMVARGYDADFAARCFHQIEGFGDYGFPESHAASFALLVYVSAWLKCYYPDIFAAALLNSQPMGFYAPAQIVRDARDHDVEIRGPDINHSHWDHTLEPVNPAVPHASRRRFAPPQHEDLKKVPTGRPPHPEEGQRPVSKDGVPNNPYALRLGLRQVKGLKEEAGQAIVAARDQGRDNPYASVGELWRRAEVTTAALTVLADGDTFGSLGLDRREAMWAIRALGHNGRETAQGLPLFATADNRHPTQVADNEPAVTLPVESDGEAVANDYTTLRLSLKNHPLALLRGLMDGFGVARNETLVERANGSAVTVAGLVLVRQRPGSANGVIFVTLEDDSGVANVIVWPDTFARFRKVVLSSRLLRIDGTLQREGIVTHVIAKRIIDMSTHLDALGTGAMKTPRRLAPALPARHPRNNHIRIASRDFH
ncbi:MAG: DNA polymerase III subunit alpha [Alphaproteobacteria bacterium]|nr:DNA polymerase III subunit alpha [Alphaproteobacteria bacterium]